MGNSARPPSATHMQTHPLSAHVSTYEHTWAHDARGWNTPASLDDWVTYILSQQAILYGVHSKSLHLGICLTRTSKHLCAQSSPIMGGARLASGSTPSSHNCFWSFLSSSPGKTPPSALWPTAHRQGPAPEQEGGAAGASAWPPHASHFRV